MGEYLCEYIYSLTLPIKRSRSNNISVAVTTSCTRILVAKCSCPVQEPELLEPL